MSLNINVTDKTLDKIKNLIIETLHLNFIKSSTVVPASSVLRIY